MTGTSGRVRAARTVAAIAIAAGTVVVSASDAGAATFTVTNGNDSGPGSYRQAIADASASSDGADVIDFDPGLMVQLLDDVEYTGTDALTLNGNGSTIDGTNSLTEFAALLGAPDAASVTVNDMTMTEGIAAEFGALDEVGAAINAAGPVTVNDSVFTDNSAGSGQGRGGAIGSEDDVTVNRSVFTTNQASFTGGAIFADGHVEITDSAFVDNDSTGGAGVKAASVTVTRSRFSGNRAGYNPVSGGKGGAVEAETITVVDSTFDDNAAQAGGGALYAGTSVEATNATFTGNDAVFTTAPQSPLTTGGAIESDGLSTLRHVTMAANTGMSQLESAAVTAFGSVFADPLGSGAVNCLVPGGHISEGFNHDTGTSCGLAAGTDTQNGGDPLLGALADNGGPTETREPQDGSPLIDAIPSGSCHGSIPAGQRGLLRPFGPGCDIGAMEVGPLGITVTNGDDSGPGSYRQAIADASAGGAVGPQTVVFDPDLQVEVTSGDVVYTGAEPLTVLGNGSSIDGNGSNQVLGAPSASSVTVSKMTVTGGSATTGGGIGASGDVAVEDSTFFANSATTGGAISAGGTLSTDHVTLSGNDAATGANVDADDLDPFATVFADPLTGTNCSVSGKTTSRGHNHATDGSCALTATGDDQSGTDPLLGPARDNGSPPTMFPLWGSPLEDAVPAGSCDPVLLTDERGVPRPFGEGCDIGAIEAVYPPHAFPDVPNWIESAVRWIVSDVNDPPLMTGYPNGTFRDTLPITRGQFVRLLYREAGAPDVSALAPHGFGDVPPWIEDAVRWAKANEVMTGYPEDNTFRDTLPISRAQVTRAKYRFAGSQDPGAFDPHGFPDVPAWIESAVRWAIHHELMTGYQDDTFRPDDDITRGQVVRLDYRLGLSPWAWDDPGSAPHTLPFRPDAP